MGYERPTLTELKQRIESEYSSRLGVSLKSGRRIVERTLAAVDAGMSHLMHGYLEFLARQIFPNTAEGEYLDAHFGWRGLSRQPATFAAGDVWFSGTEWSRIPAGTLLKYKETGALYRLEGEVVLGVGGGTGEVVATDPGTYTNLGAGTVLVLTAELPGIEKQGVVGPNGIEGGDNPEGDEEYRARIIDSIRAGGLRTGRPGDYAFWAVESAEGITRAFERRLWDSYGTLMILCLNGNEQVGEGDLQRAFDHINAEQPVGAIFDVGTPRLLEVDVSLAIHPDTPTLRLGAFDALQDYFNGAYPGQSIGPAELNNAVGAVEGLEGVDVLIPSSLRSHGKDEYPILGDVSWN